MPDSVRLLLAANTGALVVVWPYFRRVSPWRSLRAPPTLP